MKKSGIQCTTQYKFLNSIVQCIDFVVLCCLVGLRGNTVFRKKCFTVHFLTTQHKDGFYIIEASFLQRFHDASFDL